MTGTYSYVNIQHNMLEAKTDVVSPVVVNAWHTSELALLAYKKNPTNPERLYNFQEARWGLNRFAMGLSKADVAVDDCPYSEDQIRQFMGLGGFRKVSNPDFALFLPQVASTAEGLVLQGKAYPQMTNMVFQEGTPIKNVDQLGNEVSLYGWMRTEKSIDALNTNTNEDQAREAIRKVGRLPQTLNVYAEAGNISKLISPKFQYLDEVRTWVRILSSLLGGQVVYADFHLDGHCHVHWDLEPGHANAFLGVRSVGV